MSFFTISDLNSHIEEKLTKDEGFSMDIYRNEAEMVSDRETSKISNKLLVDDLADEILKVRTFFLTN